MSNFASVKRALEYIDEHLEQPLRLDGVAGQFHFSSYYFHRMFSVIAGKPFAAHVRERRLQKACLLLSRTDQSVTDIGYACGYESPQAFSRVFKAALGIPPNAYRNSRCEPEIVTVDEMIRKFTNRLQGGLLLNPSIIKKEAIRIAGVSGDGWKTAEVWDAFEKLCAERPLANNLSENGYELRLYAEGVNRVHVGYAVADADVPQGYEIIAVPASVYAAFDVYVAAGYTSENDAMQTWTREHSAEYDERLLDGQHYIIEYYDERFNGDADDSIVEMWVPLVKK